jgi:putative endonuclease
MREYSFHVYILTNRLRTVLYVGVTNKMGIRLIQHYNARGDKSTFTGRYHVYNLVYYEHYKYADKAFARETEIKGWRREKKMALIKTKNPELKFLNEEFCKPWPPVATRGNLSNERNSQKEE